MYNIHEFMFLIDNCYNTSILCNDTKKELKKKSSRRKNDEMWSDKVRGPLCVDSKKCIYKG